MATKKFKSGTGGNTFLIFLIILVAVAVFVTFAKVTQSTFKTDTYYVLAGPQNTKAVNALDVISPDMLEAKTTSAESAPPNALDISKFQTLDRRAKYALNAGDILTESNTIEGSYQNALTNDIPDHMVVTNFSVPADDAVGGTIESGTYFDIMVATPEGSFYPFVNLRTLETTVDLSEATSPDAIDTAEAQSGMKTQYYVAMTPENAAKLHSILETYPENIKLVLSPRANYTQPAEDLKPGDYTGMFQYNPDNDSPIVVGPDKIEEEPEQPENNENMNPEPETTENLVDVAKEIAQDVE